MDRTLLRNVHGRNITKVQVSQNQFLYKNQFTIQVYTKLVYWLIMIGMYMDRTILGNVQGQNITKVKAVQTMCKMSAKCVQTVCLLCANCVQAVSKLFANWLALV